MKKMGMKKTSEKFLLLKLFHCNKRLFRIVVDAIKIEFNLHKKAIKSFSSTTFPSLPGIFPSALILATSKIARATRPDEHREISIFYLDSTSNGELAK